MRQKDLFIFDLDGTLTPFPRLSALHDAPLLIRPNVKAKLEWLSGAGTTLAVTTNQETGIWNGRAYTEATIAARLDDLAALLPIPRHLMLAGLPGTRWWKPAPEMLIEILVLTDIPAERALYVGDSETDYEAARRARIDFAWAWDFFDWPNGPDDRSVDWERASSLWRKPLTDPAALIARALYEREITPEVGADKIRELILTSLAGWICAEL